MRTSQKQNFLDSLARRKDDRIKDFDLPLARYINKCYRSSVLFSAAGRTGSFFTSDSKLYYTPEEYCRLKRGERITRIIGRLDSLHSKIFENSKIYQVSRSNLWQFKLRHSYAKFRNYAVSLADDSSQKVSVVKMWNLSIVGAVIFGMFTMTMIYRYLGQGVSAAILQNDAIQTQEVLVSDKATQSEKVLGADITKEINDNIDMDSITSLLKEQSNQTDLEKQIVDMVKGYPIEKMAPLIAKQDRVVAAFLVGIARQESSWGVHVPVYKGQECWNYWGWRGKNAVGTGGHTCFATPEEAVETVAKRIKFLVSNQKLNTPEKMIVWKCGDCSWDNQRDMQRWISSVSTYFKKLNTESK
ncbi:MAG: hypothetical protein WCX17_03465 [Parcubacteria group bacterium]|jgi:hypothetical protein